MITDTGKNLDVVIITSPTKNWETFGTWYSIHKNLPEATARVFCIRSPEPSFQLFQWAKRLKIPVHFSNPFGETKITVDSMICTKESKRLNWLNVLRLLKRNHLVGENVLLIEPLTMVLSPLSPDLLTVWNGPLPYHSICEHAWYTKCVSQEEIDGLIDEYNLSNTLPKESENPFVHDAKSTRERKAIVNYKKGCGKWIHTAKGCPFHNAAGLVSDEMTSNEREIVDLWKRMVPLFSAAV
jgi:hypothetical protein